jgi:hypothetical protein
MKISTLSTLIACLILMTLATGCQGPDRTARVAMYERALSKANETSAALDDKLDHLEAIVTDTREALADPNHQGLLAGIGFPRIVVKVHRSRTLINEF